MKKNNVSGLALGLVWLSLFVSCAPGVPQTLGDYKLVWNDEFDGSAINKANWAWAVGGGGFGNNEMQYYTNSPDNSRVENGMLVIEAIKKKKGGYPYTSAKLQTMGRKEMLYGKIEVRAKLPRGVGSWPAIWMLPVDGRGYGIGWPDSGEIDLMEHVGFDQGQVHFTVHTAAFNHKIGTHKSGTLTVPDASDAFHTYGIEWEKDHIRFYMDEQTTFEFSRIDDDWMKWPFNKPFYLILNIAVGGDWGGSKGIDQGSLPWRMDVDWVRVYGK